MSWAQCTNGHRHWGPRGAAGLLVAEHARVLLQLRSEWVHSGGTWALPGGARERGESAVTAALREAVEEVGLDPDALEVRGAYVADCGGWTYETVLAVPLRTLEVHDLPETDAHRWVPVDEVADLPLHPSFRRAWDDPVSRLRDFVLTS